MIEVKTGLRPGAKKAAPGYDPGSTSIGDREKLKIAEFKDLPEGHAWAGMSIGSLRRKRSRFASGGVPGLIDKRTTKPKTRFGRQDDTVICFIREQLDAQPDGPAISVSTFHRQVERRIEEYNKTANKPIEPPPSRSTVERILKGLPEAKYVFGDATRRRSNDSSPYADLTPFYASRPGDEVQIDSTKLNCWVRSSDGKRMFRPELTLAIDVATRVVVGYRLTEESANAIDAAEVLAKILTPEPFRDGWESRLRYGYESVPHERALSLDKRLEKAARIPVIFPHNIVIDNGRTFISHVFFEACEHFGISIQTARPATGHDKAIVERFFRSLEARFLEHLEGAYTGRSVGRKGRKNPKPEELAYTLEQLDDLFAEYIVLYHDIEHDGLHIPHFEDMGVSPNKMYDFLVGSHGYLPAPATFSETIDVLPKEERTIQQYGVRIHLSLIHI